MREIDNVLDKRSESSVFHLMGMVRAHPVAYIINRNKLLPLKGAMGATTLGKKLDALIDAVDEHIDVPHQHVTDVFNVLWNYLRSDTDIPIGLEMDALGNYRGPTGPGFDPGWTREKIIKALKQEEQ